MIINTGSRTDIPAFFGTWFYNRIREGYVLVRNPYYPQQVTKYRLSPDVVDVLSFCSKNPKPMVERLHELDAYRQFWHVTITPYGRDIEPYVPAWQEVTESFWKISEIVGPKAMSWRYDPIFLSKEYDTDYHIKAFGEMARTLRESTHQCVVSFIDLYEKTKRNFPEAQTVPSREQRAIIDAFDEIAAENDLQIHLCLENADLTIGKSHVDAKGCFSREVVEKATDQHLVIPVHSLAREGCDCLLGGDIGVYNTCLHGCKYCYANVDREAVERNYKEHDEESPFMIGHAMPNDIVKEAKQVSWRDDQLSIFDFV